MTFGFANVKLRPIKLAFLIAPNDIDALLKAIEINTFLWGGMYNPLIPVFKRKPKVWLNTETKDLKNLNILNGYLDGFDPDYVVPVGVCEDWDLDLGGRSKISSSEILATVEEDGVPRYGIGLFEVCRYFAKEEFKFLRREPIKFMVPEFDDDSSLFLKSIFGSLPEKIGAVFKNSYDEIFKIKRQPCTLSNYSKFLERDNLFLRRLSSLYLKVFPNRSWGRGDCLFVINVDNLSDIIDYWNLRAVGWNVLPIVKQAVKYEDIKRFALNFIDNNYYPYRHNPSMFNNTNILKGRTITDKELEIVIKDLGVQRPKKPAKSKIIKQLWYPRIWDEWARDKDGVQCCELESRSKQFDIPSVLDRISLKTLDPKFLDKSSFHGEARFANEVELNLFGGDEIYAEVLPEGDENLARSIGKYGIHEWRFSKKGIVYLSSSANWTMSLSLPIAEDVFTKWFKLNNWEIELSPPGQIARQIIKRLGGISHISILDNKQLLEMLKSMANDKTINEVTFRGEITKMTNLDRFIIDPNRYIRRLMEARVFQLGVEIQCPICKQHSWCSLNHLDYNLKCAKCMEQFDIPSHSPKEMKWAYRTLGPFNLPYRAYGVYGVLITLHFFSQKLRGALTPLLSFNAKKKNRSLEADLALLFKESKFGAPYTELIFAECKTYNYFDKKDVNRLKNIADQFPGAFLVISTLREVLTTREKKLIRPLVNRGRRYWKAERPYNPVLILTGNELFSAHGPPECWEGMGGKFSKIAENYRHYIELLQLCDASQQLYLDMKPWHEWLMERWERKRGRREMPAQ